MRGEYINIYRICAAILLNKDEVKNAPDLKAPSREHPSMREPLKPNYLNGFNTLSLLSLLPPVPCATTILAGEMVSTFYTQRHSDLRTQNALGACLSPSAVLILPSHHYSKQHRLGHLLH